MKYSRAVMLINQKSPRTRKPCLHTFEPKLCDLALGCFDYVDILD